MALVLPVALCLASGYLIAALGWPRRRAFDFADIVLRASLSVGYGLGTFSVSFFLARVFGFSRIGVVDICVLTVLVAAYMLRRRRMTIDNKSSSTRESSEVPRWLRRVLSAAFAIAVCAALY